MPLTDYQKTWVIQQSGFDPEEYDIDESSNSIIPKVKESPAVSNTPISPLTTIPYGDFEEKDSPLKTFGKSAATSAFPAIAGGVGAGIATSQLNPFAHSLPPWSEIAFGVGGAIAGGYGAHKLQSALLPDEIEENVTASQQENPLSALAGNIVTMPLGGLNPSFANMRTAAGAIPKLASGLARTPEESAQLLNVGLGAGIGTAQPIAESLSTTGELPAGKDVLINALLGSVFNKPNTIGKKFGFKDYEAPKELPNAEDLNRGQTTAPPLQTMPQQQKPISRNDLDLFNALSTAPGTFKQTTAKPKEGINTTPYVPRTSAAESGLHMDQLIRERAPVEMRESPPVQEGIEAEIARLRIENENKTRTLEELQKRQTVIEENLSAPKDATVEPTIPVEKPIIQNQDEPQVSTKFAEEVNAGLKDKEVPTTPTNQWTELFKRFGITKRNTQVTEDGGITNTLTGKPVAGQTTTFRDALSKTLVKINPDKAGLDTAPHELAHAFIDQLRNSPKKADKDLILKFEKVVSESPEYLALKKEKGWTPEEFIATEQGLEFIRRNLNLSGETPFKTQWKDLWSHIKTKYGRDGSATNEDYRRLLQYRFQYDAPFHEYYKTGVKVGGVPNVVNQDESATKSNTLETDIESYRDLDNKRNKMISDGSAFNEDKSNFTPEFKSLWQTLEDIKNRHGGMPPESKGERVVNQDNSSIKKTEDELFKEVQKAENDLGDYDTLHKTNGFSNDPERDRLWRISLKAKDKWREAPVDWEKNFKGAVVGNISGKPFVLNDGAKTIFLKDGNTWYQKTLFARNDDGTPATLQDNILKNKAIPLSTKQMSDEFGLVKHLENLTKDINTKEPKQLNQDDSSILRKQPGEGKTPYPFKMTELENASKVKDDAFGSETLSNKAYNDLPIDSNDPETYKQNQDQPAIKLERQSFLPILTARIDKIPEKLKSPTSKYVADNLHKFSKEQDILTGNIGNKLIAAGENYSPEEIARTYRFAHQMSIDDKSSINLTGREKKLYESRLKIIRDVREIQNKMGLKVKNGEEFRAGGIDPNGYMFSEIDPNVAHIWAEKPSSVESKNFDSAYIKHLTSHGLSNKEAVEALKDYKTALGNNVNQDIEFGALRKAQGLGLPWELVDKNFNSAAIRYGKRAGRDLAYFKYIQNDPKMLKALSLKDQYGNLVPEDQHTDIKYIGSAQETKDALRSVFGIDRPRNLTTMAAARAVSNLVMGVGTSARNILNMPAFVGQYVQIKQLPLIAKAISKLGETKARAFENNAVKASFQDFDAAGYYEGSPNPAIRLMNRFSELARKYQGRNFSDKFEGEFYYSLGEQLAVDNIARAKTGDKEAARFIERFGTITDKPAELLKKQITQDDISRIAKSFVDAARGTYSEQGLPSIAIEGEFAPFFALSRFSIEKSNTIWKDVILPAKQGIYGPLIRYALGSIGVGLLIGKLNEELTGKKGAEPTINEILAGGEKEDLIAKAISTLQLASFAGIVSDGAKFTSNLIQGKSTKFNNPLSFPLYTLATETIAGNISDAVQAIREGEDPFEILGQLSVAISTQSVQSLRYIENHLNPEKTERKEKFRDYNIWQELTDRKLPDTSQARSNPFQNKASKEYKKETDIGKAVEMLPELISKAFKNSDGNPDKLKSELLKIKNNSYQTMPSPDSMPTSFLEYLQYLYKTKSEDKANETLVDYLTTNEINKVKSSLVPLL